MKSAISPIMIAVICGLSFCASPAEATLITIEITAEVDSVSDVAGLLEGRINVGDIITGSYTYDSSTSDTCPELFEGQYWHYNPPAGISLSIGGFNFTTDEHNVKFLVLIANDTQSVGDMYALHSYNNLPLSNGVPIDYIIWALIDSSANALSSDAVPTIPPVLRDWQSNNLLLGTISREGSFRIDAHVTSAVPEPATRLVPDEYATIQDAIDAAVDGDTVLVAEGTYTGEGNRDIDFLGKAITVRSENGPENCIIDCQASYDDPHRGFYFHGGENEDSVIEGFTITNGYGLNKKFGGYTYRVGGGVLCDNSNPKVSNSVFKANEADKGAGIFNYRSSPRILNCNFTANNAAWEGAAIYNHAATPIIKNCIIMGNSVQQSGGGIASWESSLFLVNCIVANNTATYYAGGIKNNHSDLTLINCTISNNESSGSSGVGVWNSPGGYDYVLIATNCILWGNIADVGTSESAQIYSGLGPAPVVDYCCIEGLTGNLGGSGNIGADPLFIDADGADDVLGTEDDNLRLSAGSPCIDTGDPNYIADPNEMDLDGRPRAIGGRIDMGAYETPIFADARIVPRSINAQSKGKWITCYIWLPEDYEVGDIDPNSVLLEDEIQAESFRVDEEQQVATARFNRSEVQGILEVGEVELTVTGQLLDGTVFEGTDTIKVINKGRKNK